MISSFWKSILLFVLLEISSSNFSQRAFVLVHSVNKCIRVCGSSLHKLQTDLLEKPNFQRYFLTLSILYRILIWNHINMFSWNVLKQILKVFFSVNSSIVTFITIPFLFHCRCFYM